MDETTSPIRIAVIGCGHWGPNHLRVFSSLTDSEVVAAVDRDEIRLERVRQIAPNVSCHHDADEVFARPDIDAVIVATPTATHYDIVRRALESGKHVLCEKPLCPEPADARDLVDLADSVERVLMVGHVFLFNPGIVRLKKLVDDDELGALQYLSATRTNLGPIRGDVNAAYDLAAHDIAIFNWLLDAEPELVSATGACFVQPGIEDVVMISLRYPNGVLASVQTSWLNPKKVRELTVVGDRQMVTWDDLDTSTPIAIYDKGAHTEQDYGDFGEFQRLTMWDGDVRLPKIPLAEPLRAQGLAFLDYIRTDQIERSDGRFAQGVVEVLSAVAQSIESDGRPIALDAVAA